MLAKLMCSCIAVLVWMLPISCHAAFEKVQQHHLPGIVVGEVRSYSMDSLKQYFLDGFEEVLIEKLSNTNKLRVESKRPIIIYPGQYGNTGQLDLRADLSKMHMAAIVHSGTFDRGKANIHLMRHVREYGEKKAIPIGKNIVKIGGEALHHAKVIGAAHDAKYLLFCNVLDADVDVKQSQASDLFKVDGLKVKLTIDYYLVNTANGKVWFGRSFIDKGTNMNKLLGLTYGKKFSVQELLSAILDKQAKKIVDEIEDKALDNIKK